MSGVQVLQRRLEYDFVDLNLLHQALTHRSVGSHNNERLEFLGDAVLGFVVAYELYTRFPSASESDLTLMRVALVRRETLAAIARELDVGTHLRLGIGERKSGGANRESILADAFEAIIGAIVSDSNIVAASKVLRRLLDARFDTVLTRSDKDPKTRLQEIIQAQHEPLPEYRIVDQSGVAHDKRYEVECSLRTKGLQTRAVGSSRREAEKAAAMAMLERMNA